MSSVKIKISRTKTDSDLFCKCWDIIEILLDISAILRDTILPEHVFISCLQSGMNKWKIPSILNKYNKYTTFLCVDFNCFHNYGLYLLELYVRLGQVRLPGCGLCLWHGKPDTPKTFTQQTKKIKKFKAVTLQKCLKKQPAHWITTEGTAIGLSDAWIIFVTFEFLGKMWLVQDIRKN